jgi:hypothetical protein
MALVLNIFHAVFNPICGDENLRFQGQNSEASNVGFIRFQSLKNSIRGFTWMDVPLVSHHI